MSERPSYPGDKSTDPMFKLNFHLMTENGALVAANTDLKARVAKLNTALLKFEAQVKLLDRAHNRLRSVHSGFLNDLIAVQARKIGGQDFVSADDLTRITAKWVAHMEERDE